MEAGGRGELPRWWETAVLEAVFAGWHGRRKGKGKRVPAWRSRHGRGHAAWACILGRVASSWSCPLTFHVFAGTVLALPYRERQASCAGTVVRHSLAVIRSVSAACHSLMRRDVRSHLSSRKAGYVEAWSQEPQLGKKGQLPAMDRGESFLLVG